MAPAQTMAAGKKQKTKTGASKAKTIPPKPSTPISKTRQSKPEAATPPAAKAPTPPVPVTTAVVAPMTEEYFPRGGASALTPLEYREVTDQAREDALFEQGIEDDSNTQKSKSSKKKRRRGDDDTANGGEEAAAAGNKKGRTGELASYAEYLSFKRLNVGMSLLGCIKEVNDLDLAISLPDQLTGYVSITEISDEISALVEKAANAGDESGDEDDGEHDIPELRNLFTVGQIVSCVIADIEQQADESSDKIKRKVVLSMKPQAVNANLTADELVEGQSIAAVIASEEDHGFVLSTGIKGTSGFLLKKNAAKFVKESNEGRPLKVGQWIYGGVLKVDDTRRIISVTLDSAAMTKSSIPAAHAAGFDTLKAGAMVNTKVKSVLENGLLLTFLGVLEGTVNLAHIGFVVHDASKDLHEHFKSGQKIRARILHVNPSRKTVALTLAPHLLGNTPFKFPPKLEIGSIITDFIVARVNPKLGIMFTHPEAGLAFAHISRLSDTPIDKVEKKFKAGQTHRARVLSFDPCDGLLQISLQKSVLEQAFLRHADIKCGMSVKGSVVRVTSAGMVIALTNSINAFCPKTHISDIVLTNPEKKFKPGVAIKCQVLSVDPKSKRVIVTHKKSLMNSTLTKITSYENIKVGELAHGVVSAVKDFGCIITFFNDVKALAPLAELSEKFVQKASDLYTVGQVVKCRVLTVDPAEEKMRVSLNLIGKGKGASTPTAEGLASLEALAFGQLVNGQIISQLADGVLVEIKSARVRAYLPKHHLTDDASKIGAQLKAMREGTVLKDLVVIGKDVKKGHAIVSLKSSLVQEVKGRKSADSPSFEDLKDGMVLPGYVKNITDRGCFVGLLGDLTGFVRLHNVSDGFVTNIGDVLSVGQTVIATIIKIDQDVRRVELSLKYSQISAQPEALERFDKTLLQSLFNQDSGPKDKEAAKSAELAWDDYTLGALVKGKITSIKDTQINISFEGKHKGRIHITQVFDKLEDIEDVKHPLAHFKVGDVVDCKVVGYHDAKNYRTLPFSRKKSPAQMAIELSVRPEDMKLPAGELSDASKNILTSLDGLPTDASQSILGFVQSTEDDAVWVHISPSLLGKASLLTHSNALSVIRKPGKHFPKGAAVLVWILKSDVDRKLLDLSLSQPGSTHCPTLETVQIGQKLVGRVKFLQPGQGITVQVGSGLHGRVHIIDIADTYVEKPLENFVAGKIVECVVIGIDTAKKQLDLSLRPSRLVKESEKLEVTNPEINSITDIKADTLVSGYIRSISNAGVFVALNHNLSARVRITDLSDAFIKDWQAAFTVGQLVTGRVLAVHIDQKRIDLSLKQSVIDPSSAPPVSTSTPGTNGAQTNRSAPKSIWESLAPGQKHIGTVKKVAEYGVILSLPELCNISGLCHTSELSDTPIVDISRVYSVGDVVKACILKVDLEKRKISFGLREQYFDESDKQIDENVMQIDGLGADAAVEMMNVDEEDEVDEMDTGSVTENESDENDEHDDEEGEEDNIAGLAVLSGMSEVGEDDDDDEEDDDEEDDDEEEEDAGALDVGGFNWDGTADDSDKDDSDEDSDAEVDVADGTETTEDQQAKKKSRRAKHRAALEAESNITAAENALLAGPTAPELASDFDRLLLGSPNSSFLWIKYMAFHLQMAEIDKARDIAERALQTIHYREEKEKMNVWVALLNLEHTYGTEESLQKTFDRAVAVNEPKHMYIHLIKIYERSQKRQKADDTYKIALKRFSTSSKLWCLYGLFHLVHNNQNLGLCRATLQRSLQSLPKRKHVKTICKFAQMEFKYGEPERGRTIFEGIISSYPKRIDLWSVYLDMEIRNGDVGVTRHLFDRALALKLSSKKMKFFFKKYLEFEKKHGNAEGIERVKGMAVAYVERLGQ
ncbi:hypothetical protein DFS34DRAFT_47062 [Phlyctochytrium arcticum]|nr:hypothetical protein DFS34DRAFT_47062 [Phlyctochytrium arcticum]